jgi:hypothetical protein
MLPRSTKLGSTQPGPDPSQPKFQNGERYVSEGRPVGHRNGELVYRVDSADPVYSEGQEA